MVSEVLTYESELGVASFGVLAFWLLVSVTESISVTDDVASSVLWENSN